MFSIATVLALFGALMVYSASAMFALKETDRSSQYTYFFKQIGFTVAHLVAMYVVSRIDYHNYQNKWFVITLVSLATLILAEAFFFPAINGAKRWIRVP